MGRLHSQSRLGRLSCTLQNLKNSLGWNDDAIACRVTNLRARHHPRWVDLPRAVPKSKHERRSVAQWWLPLVLNYFAALVPMKFISSNDRLPHKDGRSARAWQRGALDHIRLNLTYLVTPVNAGQEPLLCDGEAALLSLAMLRAMAC
jgi:hypothetical protein